MNVLLKLVVGFFAALIASMGMGGGGVLLLYLSAFTDTNQLTAQGINLIFFIPIGIVALFFHIKNKLIKKEIVLPTVLTAVPGAVAGALLSGVVSSNVLRKALAVFLLVLGLREIIGSFKKKTAPK